MNTLWLALASHTVAGADLSAEGLSDLLLGGSKFEIQQLFTRAGAHPATGGIQTWWT